MIKNLANLGDGYFQDRVWLWRRLGGRSTDHEREVLGSSFAIFKLFRGNLLLKNCLGNDEKEQQLMNQ